MGVGNSGFEGEMDEAVSRRKFDAEALALQANVAAFVRAKGWRLVSAIHPTLAIVLRHRRSDREIEFRFGCDHWDELPPSLSLHDPDDGRELRWAEWPKCGWEVHESHPTTGKPFLCLRGIREYHTHSSHIGDKWEGYMVRGTYRLRDIVDRVDQRFNDSDA